MKLDGFSDRLKLAIGNQSTNSFSKKCELTESLLRKYLSGSSLPGLDKLIAIADAADVEIKWLATGEGEMRRGGVLSDTQRNNNLNKDTCNILEKINSVELYRAIVKTTHEYIKDLELRPAKEEKIIIVLITYLAFSKEIIPETGKFKVDTEEIKKFIRLLCVMEKTVIGTLSDLNLDNMYNILSHIMGLVTENAFHNKIEM
ncbi:helix-turn-helix domain-containing protein [Pelobacter propionicus]|nr:helix-turn-helix domain-containing protein [Pelobacter propionicus]